MSGARLRLPLHVDERGERGRPLVLIHGFGANGYTWRHWAPRLSEEFRVLVLDLKGHGAAPGPDDDAYRPGDHADLVVRMIRGRDLHDVTLVGHSLGGGIALLTALRLQDAGERRLRSLVIVSGAAYPQPLPRFLAWLQKPLIGPALLRWLPARLLVRRTLRSIVHDPATVTRRQVEAYAEPLSAPGGRRAVFRGARQIVPDDLEAIVARYPGIRIPAVLVWGRQDPVVPIGLGERLARTLPRARLEVLEECGHIPQEERPDEALEIVRDFLREDDGGR